MIESIQNLFRSPWFCVITCAVLSSLTDWASTVYWEKRTWGSLLVFVFLAPIVFTFFGYVGFKFGLSSASSLTNSLLVIGPIFIGLVIRREWDRITIPQYLGIAMIVFGITLVALYQKK